MRVRFHKLTDERHRLEIQREDGTMERVECETRSYLFHDFLHFAVESEAGLPNGFWGSLAGGKTLAAMNDRTLASTPEMASIEGVTGMLSGLAKGVPAAELFAALRGYEAAQGTALPAWVTESFVRGVEERLRRLMGHFRATPYGSAMELDFPARPPQTSNRMVADGRSAKKSRNRSNHARSASGPMDA